MKSDPFVKPTKPFSTLWLVLLAIVAGPAAIPRTQAAPNVIVWDTGSRLADSVDAENRTGWKAVPSDLVVLEAEPAKAASDHSAVANHDAQQPLGALLALTLKL